MCGGRIILREKEEFVMLKRAPSCVVWNFMHKVSNYCSMMLRTECGLEAVDLGNISMMRTSYRVLARGWLNIKQEHTLFVKRAILRDFEYSALL